MLRFNEFLKESSEEVLQVDTEYANHNSAKMNAELDVLTSKPYQNAPIFLAQLRGLLERYAILLPATATANFLNLNAEMAYALGDTGNYLYITYDTNDDGFVDAYAQIVTPDELDDLMSLDSDEVLGSDRKEIPVRHSDWYRKRDDDAGNSNEY